MYRRPIVPYTVLFVLGIIYEYVFKFSPNLLITGLVLSSFVFIFLLVSKHGKLMQKGKGNFLSENFEMIRCGLLLIFVFLLGAFILVMNIVNTEVQYYSDKEIIGEVLSLHSKSKDNHKIEVRTGKYGKILLEYYDKLPDENIVGRYIVAGGDIEIPESARNPGCFDYRLNLKSRKIFFKMTSDEITPKKIASRIRYETAGFKNNFQKSLTKDMDDDIKNITTAMIFGDKTGMNENLYESFQKNGTAHILAVSGLHIGIIYAFINRVIEAGRRKKHNILIMVFLIMYCFLADFSPSVVRAVIMIALHIFSKIYHLRYDLISSACVSGITILLINPYSLFSGGFQMSYLAVLIMATISKFFKNTRMPEFLRGYCLPVLIIQGGLAPFTAYLFNYFSLGTFVANIPIIFIAGLVIPVILIIFPVYLLFPEFVEDMGAFAGELMRILVKCNYFFYSDGKYTFFVTSPPVIIILSFYVMLFFVTSEWFLINFTRKKKTSILTMLVLLLVAVSLIHPLIKNEFRDADAVFVDVGQGSCLHVRTPAGENIVIDGGGKEHFSKISSFDVGKKILIPYLLKNGVGRVDLAMISHLDADHYKGIVSICRAGMVKKIAVTESLKEEISRISRETGMKKEDILFIKTGTKFYSGKEFAFKILGPVQEGKDANANSMVVKLIWKKFSIMAPGDIDMEAEASLLERYETNKLKSDILSAPHHGSKYSSSEEFIKDVNPQFAIVQSGKNNRYGHPAPETLKRYEDVGVRVLRNDESGAIGVFNLNNRKKVKLKTMIRE